MFIHSPDQENIELFLARRILIIHFLKILDHNKLAFLKAKKNPAFEGGVLVEVEKLFCFGFGFGLNDFGIFI